MSELLMAVALWCGQTLTKPTVWVKPVATVEQINQCREELLRCMDIKFGDPVDVIAMKNCFLKQPLPGGKQ